ncbi:DEAD/DEAH box helicase [Mycoplasma mycoides subsp. mycoides]|uniref:ATP-dependent RNA helicase n=2 Tax=Mycoplasma mycoides subsp. mycoides TaxID=2103 RepID=Q6MTD9_MYCMS|nr:DEAD/DEAH box helicase [Mycoplasma mycoides]CAE77097.1 ATP-dependent RNA helicase [Mycoplasma mycoides subsp. mycoides SC str. PG1]ADK69480.1 DEAD/DEAH box helicase [Mycoplasma mycoides subsp. mycoides SC str. Gladysdale]AIZ55333.1 DEAD/DEAH box helicase [Mycoplasma mycoides subsp. mycoides]AME10679.1 ATP-dependent RNA helicase [Mycoplasma mycoides subsp. mycoides]AME11689.1 ATP-dependent RNA helicase [Mycoplasma mycoides subsp. mycoides]
MKFTDFGFKKYINDTLDQIEFIAPTSIQQKVIPLLKKHKNVIALAHTGTGKTHSFLLPILNNLKLEENNNYAQAVIISPTRELSLQIYQNTKLFFKNNPLINCNLFIGGEDISKNIEQLEKKQPHIVIGTPTRLKELYDLNKLRLTTTSYFIIDECDMIFDLGFIEDVDYLISKINQDVTIGIFSATISQQLSVFCKKYIKNAHFIDDSQNKISTSNVKHILIDTKNKELEQSLIQIINSINPFLCIIFVNQKDEISKIVEILHKNNIKQVAELHGNLQPRLRLSMLKKIQNNEFKYLVATDVASRGVDVKGVSHIISINLPNDLTYYIHRSGRTGRNNSTGYSYIIYNLKNKIQIEELIKKGIEFETKKLIDNQLVDIKTNYKKVKVFKELDAESKQVINKYKNKKVKPNYKKKRKQELDKIKQKIRRKHIKENIEKIKKAKYQKRRAELFD